MNKTIIGLAVVVVLGGGAYWYLQSQPTSTSNTNDQQPAGSKPATEQVVSENMQGKWQSNDDAKFVREIKADGTFVDWYDNETTSTGTYKVFTKANLPQAILHFRSRVNLPDAHGHAGIDAA